MSAIPRDLIRLCVSALILGTTWVAAVTPGLLEGHLKIISLKEVELADEKPSESTVVNYSDYHLVILSPDGKQEVARVAMDDNGDYRIALPPGDYVIDVQKRRRHHARVKPKPFTIVANQTVRMDMAIDAGVR